MKKKGRPGVLAWTDAGRYALVTSRRGATGAKTALLYPWRGTLHKRRWAWVCAVSRTRCTSVGCSLVSTPTAYPRHVGVILDGNRRWATLQGTSASAGHRVGGERIAEFLRWCDDVNVEVVTLWLLSTDNLTRPAQELDQLLGIITDTVHDLAATRGGTSTSGCFGPTAGGDRDRPQGSRRRHP